MEQEQLSKGLVVGLVRETLVKKALSNRTEIIKLL